MTSFMDGPLVKIAPQEKMKKVAVAHLTAKWLDLLYFSSQELISAKEKKNVGRIALEFLFFQLKNNLT